MNTQLQIDFTHIVRHANNIESAITNELNHKRFNAQCQRIYDAMMRGEVLTNKDAEAQIKYKIGDLRRRIADLIECGIEVKSEFISGSRFKKYWIERN